MGVKVDISHLKAHQVAGRLVEKQIRRAMLDMKLEAIGVLARGKYARGRLALSLYVEILPGANGPTGRLGSKLKYAASVNDGADAHYIFPRPGRTKLKFYWEKVGRVVAPSYVYHPGQRGNRFLSESLKRVGHRYNYLVFTYGR